MNRPIYCMRCGAAFCRWLFMLMPVFLTISLIFLIYAHFFSENTSELSFDSEKKIPTPAHGDEQYKVISKTPRTNELEAKDFNDTAKSSLAQKEFEVRQVIFIKVHKAASSTVQNIMFRFALERELDLMLHKPGDLHINEVGREIDHRALIKPSKGDHYDILCCHLVYDETQLAPYFPADTVKVAILREPLKQALSALSYYTSVFKTGPMVSGIKKYIDDPIRGFMANPWDFYDRKVLRSTYINNRMSLDLGFRHGQLEEARKSPAIIRDFVESIDRTFDLVLIADYFDESLVLLKRRLKWELKDVLYTKNNEGKSNFPNATVWSVKPKYSMSDLSTFREWAAVDYHLYEHFLSKLFATISQEARFYDEVHAFKQLLLEVNTFCDGQLEQLKVSESEWTESFVVTKEICEFMRLDESDATGRAVQAQVKRIG